MIVTNLTVTRDPNRFAGGRTAPPWSSMIAWHPRQHAHPCGWTLGPENDVPYAIIEKHRKPYAWDRFIFYAYRWSPSPAARELIGEYDTGDAAAEAAWADYLKRDKERHRLAARRRNS